TDHTNPAPTPKHSHGYRKVPMDSEASVRHRALRGQIRTTHTVRGVLRHCQTTMPSGCRREPRTPIAPRWEDLPQLSRRPIWLDPMSDFGPAASEIGGQVRR